MRAFKNEGVHCKFCGEQYNTMFSAPTSLISQMKSLVGGDTKNRFLPWDAGYRREPDCFVLTKFATAVNIFFRFRILCFVLWRDCIQLIKDKRNFVQLLFLTFQWTPDVTRVQNERQTFPFSSNNTINMTSLQFFSFDSLNFWWKVTRIFLIWFSQHELFLFALFLLIKHDWQNRLIGPAF